MVEQFIYTTNPQKGGAFEIVAKSSGFDRETQNQIFSSYNSISRCVLNGSGLEEHTSTSRILKPGAKKSFFGRYKDSDYETKTVITRNKIEIVDQTSSGRLASDDEDFRQNPEKAPYRLAKCELQDGRILVVRAAAIGRVYSDIDQRSGNIFIHGIIFPTGTKLTNEDILQIEFQIGLPPQKNWNEYHIPAILDNEVKTKNQKGKSVLPQEKEKCVVPQALFTSSKNIVKWQKEIDKLNSSDNYDETTEFEIEELKEKIDRTERFITDYIRKANESELSELRSQCQIRIEKLRVESELKALAEGKKFDPSSLHRMDEYVGLRKLDFKAKNQQARIEK